MKTANVTILKFNDEIFDTEDFVSSPEEDGTIVWGTLPDVETGEAATSEEFRTFKCYDDDGEWYFDARVPTDEYMEELIFSDFQACFGVTYMKDISKKGGVDLSMG